MKVRKPAVALGTTAAGIAVVVGLHPAGGPLLGSLRPPSSATTTTRPKSATTTTRPPSSATTTTRPPSATTTTRPPSAGSAKASSPAARRGAGKTATGKAIQYGYGIMTVKATVEGNKLTNVVVSSLQVADPTSEQIAVQVDPMLRSQALKLQTWRINGVSGATYTSEAYAYSLQSALSKLHFK